ncbi:unnamed protein product [Lathyrus sativus]|nr:unnamed protein product [Lathyrus sativus]
MPQSVRSPNTWRFHLASISKHEHLHEVREEDVAVWTACVPIIRFTTVKMHNSYRVKLQFRMHQNISDPPVDLSKWHLKRVNDQWDYPD